MNNQQSNAAQPAGERRDPGRYFVVGGVIPADRPGYLSRDADDQLFQLAIAGEYAHVFAPRQSGKSSLTARVAERLRERERLVAVVDLSQIGSREGTIDAARWFYSFAFRLVRQLRLRVDLQGWWQDNANLTNRQRLTELYWDVILENTTSPVTVFIDSPLPFDTMPVADDLLASINSAHNARAAEAGFSRLNFIILTVNEPYRGLAEGELSLFAASERVDLPPFTERQMLPLQAAMGLPRDEAGQALSRIHFWTSGQPFLTMKLARAVARRASTGANVEALVDDCVKQLFANPGALKSEPHLNALKSALLSEVDDPQRALTLFGRIRKGERVRYDPDSRPQRKLLDEGLVRPNASEELTISNRIYLLAFTTRWVNEHLQFSLRHTSVIVAALVAAVLLPLWYSQLLPRGWIARISNPVSIEDATEAHERMRAWPGHRGSANELLANTLEQKSLAAIRVEDVLEYDRLLRELPGTDERGDRLVAAFWDRTAADYEMRALRDQALLSRLQALALPTPLRRKQAAALIGDDYQALLTTLRFPQGIRQAAISRDAGTLTVTQDTTVSSWTLSSDPVVSRRSWQAYALTLSPVVSRVAVGLNRKAGNFRLTLTLDHDRLDDLAIRLTAPSGRSVSLVATDATSIESDRLVFAARRTSPLAALIGESANGTWTIGIADTFPAITGTLSRWQLDFGDRQTFGIDEGVPVTLPDPIPAEDAQVTLSPSGQYAVAAPRTSSGVAQVWAVDSRQAVASLPITTQDRIVGFVLDERVLIVSRPSGVAAWALATGESSWAPAIRAPVLQSALSLNSQFLVVATGGDDAGSAVYDLIEERELGKVASNIDHEAIAVANGGNLIAVADADRTVRLWRMNYDSPIAEFPVEAPVRALRFDATGRYLALVTDDRRLTIWPVADDSDAPIRMPQDGDWSVVFDPGGGGALLGNADYGYQLLEANLAAAPAPLLRPSMAAVEYTLQLRLDRGVALAYSRAAGIVQVWRTPLPQPDSAPLPRNPVRASASPNLEWLAVERAPGEISILELDAGPDDLEAFGDAVTYLGHTAPVDLLRFDPASSLLASAAADASVRIWDTESGQPRKFFIWGQPSRIVALEFAPDQSTLASASGLGIQLWNTATGALIKTIATAAPVKSLAYADNGRYLLAGLADGALVRVSLLQDWRLDRYPLSATAITSIAARDERIVAADESGGVYGLNGWADKAPLVYAATGETCDELVISSDSDYVLCRGARWLRRFPITGVATPQRVMSRLLPAIRGYAGLVDASGDGRLVATVAGNGLPVPVVLAMDARDAASLEGNPNELLRRWRNRLGMHPLWSPGSGPPTPPPASP